MHAQLCLYFYLIAVPMYGLHDFVEYLHDTNNLFFPFYHIRLLLFLRLSTVSDL